MARELSKKEKGSQNVEQSSGRRDWVAGRHRILPSV